MTYPVHRTQSSRSLCNYHVPLWSCSHAEADMYYSLDNQNKKGTEFGFNSTSTRQMISPWSHFVCRSLACKLFWVILFIYGSYYDSLDVTNRTNNWTAFCPNVLVSGMLTLILWLVPVSEKIPLFDFWSHELEYWLFVFIVHSICQHGESSELLVKDRIK